MTRTTNPHLSIHPPRGHHMEGRSAGPVTLGVAIAAAVLSLSSPVAGATDIEARIAALETQLNELKAAQQAAAQNAVVRSDHRGAVIASADGEYGFALNGVVHSDARYFISDEANDTFLFRRVRPTINGKLGSRLAFRLTPEFAGNSATLLDAYADVTLGGSTSLRVGQFKSPVSLERLISASSLPVMERAFPAELAGNRDIGAYLQGSAGAGPVAWGIGVFTGTADGRNAPTTNPDDEFELAGRIFLEPWRGKAEHPLQGLGFGIAGSAGEKSGSGNDFLPRYRSPGQETIFSYASSVAADGDHVRLSPQAYYYRGPLGLMAEYIQSEQGLVNSANGASDKLRHQAWQITASYVLTGEANSYRGPSPRNDFTPGHPGAWEVVARVSGLDLDGDSTFFVSDPSAALESALAYAAGVNWFLTRNTKISLNYQLTRFDGGRAGGRDRRDEEILLSRLQFAF